MQLYDGTRLYVGAGTMTFPTDTWLLDRVEVMRGPASALYGRVPSVVRSTMSHADHCGVGE